MTPNQRPGMTLRDPQNPHGTARAARGHARLGYAGGSWRSPEPADVGDRETPSLLNCQLTTCNLGKCSHVRARKNANHKRHIPARLFDMFGKCVVVVIDGMLVNCSVRMPMGDSMTVVPAMRAENKAKIIMASVAGRRFRCRNKYTLKRKSDRGRHHHRDSHMLQKWSPCGAQRIASWVSPNGQNTLRDYGMPSPPDLPSGPSVLTHKRHAATRSSHPHRRANGELRSKTRMTCSGHSSGMVGLRGVIPP